MNVFDFDNTIYRGESSVDFALFMIKNDRKIILWLPSILWNMVKYKLCLVSREKMESTINDFLSSFIRDKSELISDAERFWTKNARKLDRAMLSKIREEDAIITAGPAFLLEDIKEKLGTSNMICSEVDFDKKRVAYLNFGENKVKRYRELYGDKAIECFYTDSYNDQAMMDISDRVFIVSKGRIKRIK